MLAAAVTAAVTGLLTSALTSTPRAIRSAVGGRQAAPTVDAPIVTHVEEVNAEAACQGMNGSVYPRPLEALVGYGSWLHGPQAQNEEAFDQQTKRWKAQHGAVTADYSRLIVTVQGRSDAAVLLTGLRFHVARRDPPLQGIHIVPLGQCGDEAVRKFAVDLDKAQPTTKPIGSYPEANGKVPVSRFPYKVSRGDPEYIELVAYTRTHECTWTATLDWVADGKPGSTALTGEGGAPFRVTSTRNASAYQYDYGGPDNETLRRAPDLDWKAEVPDEAR